MAFRADEAARVGYEQIEAYLVPRPRDADETQRARSKEALQDIVDELGPVVDAYPRMKNMQLGQRAVGDQTMAPAHGYWPR